MHTAVASLCCFCSSVPSFARSKFLPWLNFHHSKPLSKYEIFARTKSNIDLTWLTQGSLPNIIYYISYPLVKVSIKAPQNFIFQRYYCDCHRTPSRMVWHIPSELIIEMQIITNRQQRAFQIWIRSDWEIRVLVTILTLDKMLNKPRIQLLCKPFQLAKCSAWPRSWMGEALYLIAQYEYCSAFLAGLKQFMRPARVSQCESG